MNEFVERFAQSLRDDEFIQLVLSSPIKTVEPRITKVTVRGIDLKSGYALQFTRLDGAQELHEHLDPQAAIAEVQRIFGQRFRHAHLFTVSADISAKQKASGKLKMLQSKPSKQAASKVHNRKKQYLIPEGTPCAFLEAIGIMNADGRVFAPKFDKFKQINRFLESFLDQSVSSFFAKLTAKAFFQQLGRGVPTSEAREGGIGCQIAQRVTEA